MGFAAGFQTGAQAVERGFKMREEDQLKRGLAQAYAQPTTSQGYTAETGQQLEELAKTGAYDIVPQYAPPAEGQTQGIFTGYQAVPKAGLDLQGDMPAAPMAFNPQQVQEYAGQRVAGQFDPTVLRGLQAREAARVVAASGDYRGAAALEAQAEEQAFQAKYRPLQLQQVEGQLAGQAQQRELTGLQLTRGKRDEEAAARGDAFSAYAAENPNATVGELKDAAFKQFKFSPKQWEDVVTTRLNIDKADLSLFKSNIQKKLQGKSLTQLGTLYNTDPDFDDKTDLAIVPGKGGAVTLNFIDKASGKVTGSQAFKNEALATEYLNKQATEPETIGSWMMNLRKAEGAISAQEAATEASRATTGLRGAQMLQIRESAANADARASLQDKFDALTDAQKNGPEGDAIVRQFNLLNAKAGGQVALRAPPKAAGPVRMDDLDKENLRFYRDWEKDPRNAKLPQGQKDAKAAQLGVTQFINRSAEGPATGLGSNPFAAGTPTAAPAAAPRGIATAPVAAPAAPVAPALNTQNTKILSAAGDGWNVQLPDGTTRVMSVKELNKLGYQFLGR